MDVAASVEALGRKLGFTIENNRYTAVSLGQGQEVVAMNALLRAHQTGGWVLLQNIHLTIEWTSGALEKKIDKLADGAHPDFRCMNPASCHVAVRWYSQANNLAKTMSTCVCLWHV